MLGAKVNKSMKNIPMESIGLAGWGGGHLETNDSASAVDIKPLFSVRVVWTLQKINIKLI